MGLEILEKIPDSACCASVLRYEGNRREEALSQDLNPLKKKKTITFKLYLIHQLFFWYIRHTASSIFCLGLYINIV